MKLALHNTLLFCLLLTIGCDTEEPPTFRDTLKNCDNPIVPEIVLPNGEEKILTGNLLAEIYDDVEYIEVSTYGPAFGREAGHTQSYQVSSFPEEDWISLGAVDQSVFYWNLPFELNETNQEYSLEVTYYCESENGSTPGHHKEINVSTIDFCSEISSNLTGGFEFSQPLINGDWQGPITETSFNVRFHTYFRVDQGFGLLIFPIENVDHATVYLNTGNEFSANFPLQWSIEEVEIDPETTVSESYLSADLDLEELFDLTYDDMRDANVYFSITLCGNEFDKGGFTLQ